MKTKLFLVAGKLALPVLLTLPLCAAENWVRYDALPAGSKAKVDGTSTIHDWTVESRLIAGHVEFDSGFNLDQPAPGKVNAHCVVTIPVRQLKSDSTKMDTVMYEHIKQKDYPRIEYRLTEKGHDLRPVVQSIHEWAQQWIELPQSPDEQTAERKSV